MSGEDDIRKAIDGAEPYEGPGGGPDFERKLAGYPKNDIGNARRLRDRFGRDLIYVQDVGWHHWTGTHWNRADGERMAQILAHSTVRHIRDEAEALEEAGPEEGEDKDAFGARVASHFKWAVASGNSARIGAMVKEAQPYLTRQIEVLDSGHFLLNVLNGTLELRKPEDGGVALREHRRGDFITKLAPVKFDPDADCPEFRTFLGRILPVEAIRVFVQRWAGYSATGDASEQVLCMFYGQGANGKSTLVELLAWLLSDYATSLPIASLLHDERRRGSEASPDLAGLPGRRMVIAAEPDAGARISESLVKVLTGGDTMKVRRLNHDFFEFKPLFKLVILANHRPAVRGQDDGIWRRLLLVLFGVTIPAGQRDRGLLARLKAEASGVLNWVLDGTRLWLDGGLAVPDEVRAATDSYRADSDPVGQFLDMATRRVAGGSVQAARLYQAYTAWCKENAVSPLSSTGFGRRIGDRGFEKVKIGLLYYQGLELVERYANGGGADQSDEMPPGPPADAYDDL